MAEKLISLSLQSPNLIRLLTSKGASIDWPAADKLGTHFLRRRALTSAGGPFAQLSSPPPVSGAGTLCGPISISEGMNDEL